MCLGVPGRIVDVNGQVATVDFWGVRRQVRLDLVDAPVGPGDYILNHVGFAIRRIPEDEIEGTLELYEELLRSADADDLMTADVRGELGAGAAEPKAGAAELDAGPAAELDAGPAAVDAAGSAFEAGVPALDAAVPTTGAAVPAFDAGVPPFDTRGRTDAAPNLEADSAGGRK